MIIFKNGSYSSTLSNGVVIAIACVTLAVTIAFYLLRSIGLYTLAKRHGIRKAFMAWIPYVWIFVVCKLIKESNIFGFSFGKFAWLFTLVVAFAGILPLIKNFIDFFPYVFFYLEGGTVVLESTSAGIYVSGIGMVNHFDTQAMYILTKIFSTVGGVLSIIAVVVEVFAYIALFRKFWPERYILGAVLSAMGIFPPLVFAIRKKKAVNFVEYMRSRYYYNNPYGPNQYSQQNVRRERPENPFGEFDANKKQPPEDPFEEFNDKDKR